MFASLTRLIRLTFLILILLAVIVFTVSNREGVTLSLFPLPFELSLPLYLFFLVTLAIGYLVAMLSYSFSNFRYRREAKKEHRKVEALEQEVSSLRAQAATASAPKITQDDES